MTWYFLSQRDCFSSDMMGPTIKMEATDIPLSGATTALLYASAWQVGRSSRREGERPVEIKRTLSRND